QHQVPPLIDQLERGRERRVRLKELALELRMVAVLMDSDPRDEGMDREPTLGLSFPHPRWHRATRRLQVDDFVGARERHRHPVLRFALSSEVVNIRSLIRPWVYR